ncbi:MAG: 4'-phosphopantetheinyl transferase superfamily protein [Gemmatimonadetes bacterium]|nr:4'-phosphopantetheinyl transferase superfamily protein [Gemmatimonadota bacterium]
MKPLRNGIAYIWEGRLDAGSAVTAAARALLSPRERSRADRFVYDHHRRRYTVAQAHLRRVLGNLTGDHPATIRFQYGEHGKPFLADGPVFNQSHSSERVMIGVAAQGRLGIDIEKRRTVRLMSEIARKNFAPAESELFRHTPAPDRQHVFFQLWTCKEAFLKALGVGLTAPLRSFSVDPSRNPRSALVHASAHGERPSDWHVGNIPCSSGATAAIAIDCPGIAVEPLGYDPAGL